MSRPLSSLWQALSEVPGWPDAPLSIRLRRLWPLILPLLGCIVLAAWTILVREPARREIRAAHAGLLQLEQEVEQLRQTLSDQTAADLVAQAAAARAELLESPAALQERLQAYLAVARAAGWEASFQVYAIAGDESSAAETAPMVLVPARVRLEPTEGQADRFTALIHALTRLAALPGSIEITRVAIRSDQPGAPVVDVNLRAACRPTHEKAAQ